MQQSAPPPADLRTPLAAKHSTAAQAASVALFDPESVLVENIAAPTAARDSDALLSPDAGSPRGELMKLADAAAAASAQQLARQATPALGDEERRACFLQAMSGTADLIDPFWRGVLPFQDFWFFAKKCEQTGDIICQSCWAKTKPSCFVDYAIHVMGHPSRVVTPACRR